MRSHNIVFERDINKSYMKVSSVMKESFDEKLILSKNFDGVVPMEKCFVNGMGQYWYHISGKQALEDFCTIHEVGKQLFETLILRICNQLEVLEWNLVDANCLVVSPEYIFLNSTGEDISFVLYPDNQENIQNQFQKLLEYLLTKINHNEQMVVKLAYQIYEMVLSESYSVTDIKNIILEGQRKECPEEIVIGEREPIIEESTQEVVSSIQSSLGSFLQCEKLADLFEKVKSILQMEPKDLLSYKRGGKEGVPDVVYPETVIAVETACEKHPTVCLSSILNEPEGLLVYEGRGEFEDLRLEHMLCVIGKSHKVKLQIEKETISNYHAKIDFLDGDYYIEDMNSTNGTYVNDEMLNYKEVRKLSPGDTVRFADVKYRFL